MSTPAKPVFCQPWCKQTGEYDEPGQIHTCSHSFSAPWFDDLEVELIREASPYGGADTYKTRIDLWRRGSLETCVLRSAEEAHYLARVLSILADEWENNPA